MSHAMRRESVGDVGNEGNNATVTEIEVVEEAGINGADDNDDVVADVGSVDNGEEVKLERVLGLLDAIMINLGVMIGSGIFISPAGVVAGVTSVGATLVVWVSSGAIALLGALCYAELGTMFMTSGGTYTYLREIFGDLLSFTYLWAFVFLVLPCSHAVISLAFSYYCLRPFFPDSDCPPPEIAVRLLAVTCLLFVSFVNCWSVRLAALVENLTSLIKLIALAVIIVSGMVLLGLGHRDNFKHPFQSTQIDGLGSALYACLYSYLYCGFDCLNVIVEEIKNPTRNLPIAIVASISILTVIFLLTNIAYFTVLTPAAFLASEAVAVSFAVKFLGHFAWVVPVAVALSSLGSVNGDMMTYSRTLFIGARDRHSPGVVSMISIRHKTPTPVLFLETSLGLIFCFTDNIFTLLNYMGFVKWLYFGIVVAGLLYLRVKEPNRQRPFRVSILVPVAFLLACVFLTICGIAAAPIDAAIGGAILLSAVPVYFVAVKPSSPPKWTRKVAKTVVIFLQKLMLVVPQEGMDNH